MTSTTTSSTQRPTTTTLAAKTEWATFGFDLQRTSHNPSEVALGADTVGNLAQVWSADVGAVVSASPVLASDVSVNGTPLDLTHHGEPVTVTSEHPVRCPNPRTPALERPTQPPGREPARRRVPPGRG